MTIYLRYGLRTATPSLKQLLITPNQIASLEIDSREFLLLSVSFLTFISALRRMARLWDGVREPGSEIIKAGVIGILFNGTIIGVLMR